MVFGYSLFKGVPPVFIATEAGICYQPAGISTGWILWREVADVKETTILAGAPSGRRPTLQPVLGIRFHYPDIMNRDMYAPLLQRVVQSAQELYGAQTDGAGDLLLLPSDFGDAYEDVKSLFRTYPKADLG